MYHKKWLTIIGTTLTLLAASWFTWLFTQHMVIFSALSPHPLIKIYILSSIYSVTPLLFGFVWWLLVRYTTATNTKIIVAISIFCISQIGKYLPGNIAHHAGRAVLARRHGIPLDAIVFTMFMEIVWVIAVASLLALASLWFLSGHPSTLSSDIPQWWVLLVIALASIALPFAGHKVITRIAILWGRHKGITISTMSLPPPRIFCAMATIYLLYYLILGIVLHSIALHLFGTNEINILALTGIFAAAWIAGFITPGAPAGLGVREVILISAMTPFYGQSIAVGVASILRIVTVLGDGMGFLMGLLLSRLSRS